VRLRWMARSPRGRGCAHFGSGAVPAIAQLEAKETLHLAGFIRIFPSNLGVVFPAQLEPHGHVRVQELVARDDEMGNMGGNRAVQDGTPERRPFGSKPPQLEA